MNMTEEKITVDFLLMLSGFASHKKGINRFLNYQFKVLFIIE